MMKNIPVNGDFVYLLLKGDDVVYVGQSINYTARIASHKHDKDFDSFDLVPVSPHEDLNLIEFAYIAKFQPKHNKMFPTLSFLWTERQLNMAIELDKKIGSIFNKHSPDLDILLYSGRFKFWAMPEFDDELAIINGIMEGKDDVIWRPVNANDPKAARNEVTKMMKNTPETYGLGEGMGETFIKGKLK